MTSPVDQAAEDAKSAREQLLGTVQEIRSRLVPKRLFEDAVSDVKTRSTKLARSVGETAKQRPMAAAALVAASIALLAHRPLWRLVRKMIGRPLETCGEDAS